MKAQIQAQETSEIMQWSINKLKQVSFDNGGTEEEKQQDDGENASKK